MYIVDILRMWHIEHNIREGYEVSEEDKKFFNLKLLEMQQEMSDYYFHWRELKQI